MSPHGWCRWCATLRKSKRFRGQYYLPSPQDLLNCVCVCVSVCVCVHASVCGKGVCVSVCVARWGWGWEWLVPWILWGTDYFMNSCCCLNSGSHGAHWSLIRNSTDELLNQSSHKLQWNQSFLPSSSWVLSPCFFSLFCCISCGNNMKWFVQNRHAHIRLKGICTTVYD